MHAPSRVFFRRSLSSFGSGRCSGIISPIPSIRYAQVGVFRGILWLNGKSSSRSHRLPTIRFCRKHRVARGSRENRNLIGRDLGIVMEDEDFGFTKRNDNILRNIDNNDAKRNDEDSSSPSKTKTGETVGEPSSVTTAPLSGATEAGNAVPERAAIASSSSLASSVVSNPPNIPNVVEYHLKVKPGQTQRVCGLDNTTESRCAEEMKKETKSPVSSNDKKKDLVSKLSRLSIDNNVFEGSTDLPQVFQVKYLGSHDARGLWGIKHTRRPVDNMVAAAKALPTNTMLPLIKLIVSREGVALLPLEKRKQEPNFVKMYSIETISYGVQDLVYTRVFSMIVVRETENFRRVSPFECHGFVCESKHHARQLTYALAAAFEIYSRTVRAQDKMAEMTGKNPRKRFAIDLRSPEEIEADLVADSEA